MDEWQLIVVEKARHIINEPVSSAAAKSVTTFAPCLSPTLIALLLFDKPAWQLDTFVNLLSNALYMSQLNLTLFFISAGCLLIILKT